MALFALIAAMAICFSFLCDFWFNRIVFDGQRQRAESGQSQMENGSLDLLGIYHASKPPLLRKLSLLDVIVERGGGIFFFIFAISVIGLVYQRTRSFLWVLVAIPFLILVFIASNQCAVYLAGRHTRQ